MSLEDCAGTAYSSGLLSVMLCATCSSALHFLPCGFVGCLSAIIPAGPWVYFRADGLHGNLLSVADEEGSVRLLDTRKPAAEALCRGMFTDG